MGASKRRNQTGIMSRPSAVGLRRSRMKKMVISLQMFECHLNQKRSRPGSVSILTVTVSAPSHQPSSFTWVWNQHRATADSEVKLQYIHIRNIYMCLSFSVAGPASWNGLPTPLRQIPVDHSISFLSALKTVMCYRGWTGSAYE